MGGGGGQWKDRGPGGNILDRAFDTATLGALGTSRVVENEKTGELREVYVAQGQTVGEAVAKR